MDYRDGEAIVIRLADVRYTLRLRRRYPFFVIMIDPSTGALSGASDPRKDGMRWDIKGLSGSEFKVQG